MRRRPVDTYAYTQTVVSLCSEHGFPFWGAGGQILQGWAMSHDDPDKGVEQIRAGLAAWRKTGARLWLPIFVALEGEAHAAAGRSDAALRAVNEAISISRETGERWAIAEVIRLKAKILSKSGRGEADEIEACSTKASKPLACRARTPGGCEQPAISCSSNGDATENTTRLSC
jgi:predicted ATPase